MRIDEHNLNSLRKIIRELQDENHRLRDILDDHHISYETESSFNDSIISDFYDEDQGARIMPLDITDQTAKEFYQYFWGRTDVYAKRGKNGGYYPQCVNRFNNPMCPKARDEKKFCDEDCEYRSWRPLELWMVKQHLQGMKEDCSDVIGVYPLFPDNTCRFLVFDFDNHGKDAYKNDDANTDSLYL